MKNTIKHALCMLFPESINSTAGTIIRKLRGGNGVSIPFLVLVVGNACSLRCKKCGNFCPMAKKENRRYEWGAIVRDLRNVLNCVNNVRLLQIQGGEPFLHSNLDKVLDFCAGQSKIWQTEIATNGTIMPTETLLGKIKAMGIRIRISNYSVSHEKGIALHEKCGELGIRSSIYHFAYGKNEWADLGDIDTPREDDDEVVRVRFSSCAFRGCLTLENGELNRCSRIHVAHSLQGFMRRKDDHVDVTKKLGLKKRLRRYLQCVDFPEACRYCLGNSPTNTRRCIPGEQMESTGCKERV